MAPTINTQPKLEKNMASLRAAAIEDRIKNAVLLPEASGKAACARFMNLQNQ